jgi:hypothetical protein
MLAQKINRTTDESLHALSETAQARRTLGSLLGPFPVWCGMAKPKVTFRSIRNSDDDWTIIAEYPGAEPREIAGFKSKADVDDWTNGDRKVAWLRSQGYAK